MNEEPKSYIRKQLEQISCQVTGKVRTQENQNHMFQLSLPVPGLGLLSFSDHSLRILKKCRKWPTVESW